MCRGRRDSRAARETFQRTAPHRLSVHGPLWHVGFIPTAALCCELVTVSLSRAGCPDITNSYVAPCLIACPAGDSVFVVILRDCCFVPWDGEKVILDFSNC